MHLNSWIPYSLDQHLDESNSMTELHFHSKQTISAAILRNKKFYNVTKFKPSLINLIVDFHDKAVTDGKVVREKNTVCPDSTFKMDASKTTTVEYTSKCGKLKTIDVKSDAKDCDQFKTETDQPIPTFYLKAKADGTADGKCELASNPKILVK